MEPINYRRKSLKKEIAVIVIIVVLTTTTATTKPKVTSKLGQGRDKTQH